MKKKRLGLVCALLTLASSMMLGQSNPVPLINQPLVPASASPGGGGFTLTINGTGFTSTAAVYWNGSIRATTVVSSSQVQAQISAADIAKPGFGWVTVGNQGAVEVQSNVVYFPIRSSAKGLGFLPRSIQNVGSDPGTVAVGDFNNDGLLDFAVVSGTIIQVFLGKGNGTFQLPVATTLKGIVSTMVAGDFNGDGKLDLAVLHYNQGHCCLINVFLGNGDGTFKEQSHAVSFNYALNLSAADFNGDGKLDLYAAIEFPGDHCGNIPCFDILLGNGDGTFTLGFSGNLPLPPTSNEVPAIADYNGDGKLDIAVGGINLYGKGVVAVFLNEGNGNFGTRASYPVMFGGDSVIAADVNGDGKIDLVTDGVSVLLGNGDGTFRRGMSVLSDGSGSVTVGDFNGDGKLDILAGLNLLLGNGNGTFQKPLIFAGMGSRFPISVSTFDANGNLDMLGIDALNGSLSIFEQRPLYFTPNNLDFGAVLIGTTSPPQNAGLTNFGATKLDLTINITGANSADFTQSNNCGASLPPNASCKIQVTFAPNIVGNESASLNVTYQGSAPLSMPLTGVGTDQTFTVTLTPSSLTFAAQLVGSTSTPQTATLTNTGNQPVTISNIAATALFSQTNNCPSTLGVGGNCQIQVTFTPTDKGIVNGTLSVTDNATGSPQTVTLSGTGTVVVFSPTKVNFGNQKVGTSSVPIPVTLSNVGPSSLSVTQIAIQGADPNDFTQKNTCGNSVPPQSKCTITVTFTPKAKGSRLANVSISDNDPTSPQTVPLTGNGT